MSLNFSFDINRVTNLEDRASSNEVIAVTNNDTTQQTIPNLLAPTLGATTLTSSTVNVTGLNNSLIQTTGVANTQWIGGMEDPNTYYWTLGKFHANTRDTELRSYKDNLIFRSGRSVGAAAGGISLITNDGLTAGINSNVTITCNTGGIVTANTSYNGTAFNTTSARKFKEQIEEFKLNALELIEKTPVRKYILKADQKEHIGLILDESPEQLQEDEEHISLYSMCSMLWKGLQELSQKVDSMLPQTEEKL
jgi:hypothetical protein